MIALTGNKHQEEIALHRPLLPPSSPPPPRRRQLLSDLRNENPFMEWWWASGRRVTGDQGMAPKSGGKKGQ